MHTMEKFFNTAGPAQEDIHYTLNPLRRIRYDEISQLIDQRPGRGWDEKVFERAGRSGDRDIFVHGL